MVSCMKKTLFEIKIIEENHFNRLGAVIHSSPPVIANLAYVPIEHLDMWLASYSLTSSVRVRLHDILLVSLLLDNYST
jgi:hypothetical protein